MERIYNFNLMQQQGEQPASPASAAKVRLQNQHLVLSAELADDVIGQERQVYAVYYDNIKSLLLAPETDQTFRQAHEVIMLFVKVKNAQGDKSISLQEFYADWPDLDASDRDLDYMSQPGLQILHVLL